MGLPRHVSCCVRRNLNRLVTLTAVSWSPWQDEECSNEDDIAAELHRESAVDTASVMLGCKSPHVPACFGRRPCKAAKPVWFGMDHLCFDLAESQWLPEAYALCPMLVVGLGYDIWQKTLCIAVREPLSTIQYKDAVGADIWP